ncbi:MAG: FAD-dependent oxidoreductase [Deltaproteobacteria bacterium]|nr:FAD-dependent oxidoreductase [Deltaproteobacteria bacterium]
MNRKKLLIVGGVAGGASCAVRARRLSEDAEIIMLERGPYVSFANCGLPYHVGKVISKEEYLLVASPELFRDRFKIDVRIQHNVRRILREEKSIEVESLTEGEVYRENYDALVLSPGSEPIRPTIPGVSLPGIFTVSTIPDTRRILQWINENNPRRAVVVGGGFIGLEMAENLIRRKIGVSIAEMQKHVMPALDPEMGAIINDHLRARGVDLYLGSPVSAFRKGSSASLCVCLDSGKEIEADLVILCIGVRPRIELAEAAGLRIGECGGIWVDDQMRTSDDNIWAVGDAVEVKDYVLGGQTMVPLAGPANRQGRIAADVILGNGVKKPRFRGVQATAVCGVLGLTIASTGKTERQLIRAARSSEIGPFEKVYLHPYHHATYYPNAKHMCMKLIFAKKDGRILGAQAVGREGVEKRIDVIAMAIQKNGTVFDLEEAELCYAPQYGSAKDPVNLAGMVAANTLRGLIEVAHWEDLKGSGAFILDVRDLKEYERDHVEGAVNIPLNSLRERMGELPRDQDIFVYCLVGIRSYLAARILRQNGFRAKNISGGIMLYPFVKQIYSSEF